MAKMQFNSLTTLIRRYAPPSSGQPQSRNFVHSVEVFVFLQAQQAAPLRKYPVM